MRLWLVLVALLAALWSPPAAASQDFCGGQPSGWWNPMMTELPENLNRIRATRWGLFWNGTRISYTGLRERLRQLRATQAPVFTLLEYENWLGCAGINRLRTVVSSTLACSEALCGETIVAGYHRAPRRRASRPETEAAIRQAERDIERARRQAERALDAMERAADEAERAASDPPIS